MTLPASGAISLSDIQTEFGGSNPISINEYYKGGTYVPNTTVNVNIPTSGVITFSNFYNGSKSPTYQYFFDVFSVDNNVTTKIFNAHSIGTDIAIIGTETYSSSPNTSFFIALIASGGGYVKWLKTFTMDASITITNAYIALDNTYVYGIITSDTGGKFKCIKLNLSNGSDVSSNSYTLSNNGIISNIKLNNTTYNVSTSKLYVSGQYDGVILNASDLNILSQKSVTISGSIGPSIFLNTSGIMTGTLTVSGTNTLSCYLLNSNNTMAWCNQYGTYPGTIYSKVNTNDGTNAYVSGTYYVSGTSSYYGYLLKLSSTGAVTFSKRFYITSDQTDLAVTDITLDPSGNIYISGYSTIIRTLGAEAFSSTSDIFILKFNSSGSLLGSRGVASRSLDQNLNCRLFVDNSYIYITGKTEVGPGVKSGLIAKFPSNLSETVTEYYPSSAIGTINTGNIGYHCKYSSIDSLFTINDLTITNITTVSPTIYTNLVSTTSSTHTSTNNALTLFTSGVV